jgi:hypothetical protein
LGFFVQLHRSVVDPSFYVEALAYPVRKIAGFLVCLLLFTTFVSGLAQLYYLFDKKEGIPEQIETTFRGMEIKNGILASSMPMPYYPVLSQYLENGSDSAIVIDTAVKNSYLNRAPIIVMQSNRIVFAFTSKKVIQIPYKTFLGVENFKFTAGFIREFLTRNIVQLILYIWIAAFFQNIIFLAFSVLFLTLAAFIFRIEKQYSLKDYLRVACFAVSPVSIGTILVAISGVKFPWTWHLFIFISTIVMFRAIVATTRNSNNDSGDKIWS